MAPQLTVVNQMDAAFGRFLSDLDPALRVLNDFETKAPWQIPLEAEVLITRARPEWKSAPQAGLVLPNLRWIQTYSSGIEIYPDWLKSGRIVTCGRGLTAPQIAEYVMAAILRRTKRLDDVRASCPADWQQRPLGTIEGQTLGLIGFGAIGHEVAQRAVAFGMHVIACRRGEWVEKLQGVKPVPRAENVMQVADHIVLAMPLTKETSGMIDDRLLAMAKPGAHLINIARGGLVADGALEGALEAGHIGFATLDVTSPEPLPLEAALWTNPKVLLTPHISYLGDGAMERFREKVAFNLKAYMDGTSMLDIVDIERGY